MEENGEAKGEIEAQKRKVAKLKKEQEEGPKKLEKEIADTIDQRVKKHRNRLAQLERRLEEGSVQQKKTSPQLI